MPRASNTSPRRFADKVYCDAKSKSAIACRDGVLLYDGAEIGEQSGKTYRVYRSPASTALASQILAGLPLYDDHVSDPSALEAIGKIEKSTLIDMFDDSTSTTMGVKTSIELSDEAMGVIESGKKELSLGYDAVLSASSDPRFDFIQSDLLPNHLAIVERGRAGSSCAFLDRAMTKKMENLTVTIKKLSLFDEGEDVNLESVAMLVQQLPEAIKKVPLDTLKDLVPQLQAVIEAAKAMMPEAKPEQGEDEQMGEKTAEEEKKNQQAADAALIVAKAIAEHTEAIERAREFVDADYKFAGKSTMQIMRDAVATEHGNASFSDAEIKIAFKMLKRSENAKLAQFGDSNASNPFWDLVD